MAFLLAIGFPIFPMPSLESTKPGFPFVLTVILGIFFYFLPSMVAGYRRETHWLIVLGVNLLLGWSLIVWFATLLFAIYGETQTQAKARDIGRQRRMAALSGSPAFEENPPGPASELDHPALRRDPRGAVAVLLGAAALLAVVAQAGPFSRLTSGSPEGKITNAAATSPGAPLPNELAFRATFQDILNACGQPERRWTTSSGQGTSLQTVDHLFYSRVPAEIRLAIRPNANREQSRHWTFAGAALAPDSTSTYSGQQLKEHMPCMTSWADALAAREAQNLNGNVH
jgi:hypothetical protein